MPVRWRHAILLSLAAHAAIGAGVWALAGTVRVAPPRPAVVAVDVAVATPVRATARSVPSAASGPGAASPAASGPGVASGPASPPPAAPASTRARPPAPRDAALAARARPPGAADDEGLGGPARPGADLDGEGSVAAAALAAGDGEGAGGGRGSGAGGGPSGVASAGSAGASLSARDGERVRDAVQRALRYPRQARQRRLEGTVEVRFRVGPAGGVDEAQVVASAGALLDDAALAAVRRAAPFAVPPGWVRIPVVFELGAGP